MRFCTLPSILLVALLSACTAAAQTWTYQGNSSCFHNGDNKQCFENGTLQRYATSTEQFEAGYRTGQELGQGIGLLIQAWMAHRRQLNLEREDIRGQITAYYHATYDLDDEISGYEEAMISAYNRLQSLDPPRRSMYEEAERSAETLVAHLGHMRPMTEKNLPGILAAKDVKFLQSNLELSQRFYNQAVEASKKEYVFSQLISAYAGSLESSQSASRFLVVTPLPASTVSSAPPTPAPTSANAESTPSSERIATIRGQAASGNAKAQVALGSMYFSGQGVPQDYTQAAVWYRKAAEQGDADAQFNLGQLCNNGRGVPQDQAQAAAWYLKAAEQGVAQAQENIGVLYAQGQGVPQDYAEAYFWLDIAAAGNLDSADAKGAIQNRNHAASYLTPPDLSREQERARKWFEDHPAKPQ